MRSIAQRGRRRITAGDLDKEIAIEHEARVPDDFAGSTSAWSVLSLEAAAVESVGGSEDGDRGGVRGRSLKRFTIYRRDDLTEAMRIVYGGRTYNIRDLDDPASEGMFQSIIAESGEGD